MKIKIAIMLLVLLILSSIPFIWRSSLPTGGVVQSPMRDVISNAKTQQIFYKWQDEQGRWHMGDEPPEGVKLHPIEVDTAANILQPVVAPKATSPDTIKQPSVGLGLPSPLTIQPEQVKTLLQDAQNVQQLMKERTQQIEQFE